MIFDTTGYTTDQKADAREHRLVGRLKQFLKNPKKEMKCFVNPTNPTMFKLITPKDQKPKDFKSTPGATFFLCTIAPIIKKIK